MVVDFPRDSEARPPCRAGFTLIELLAVIAIIGILAGITFGLVSYVAERNRGSRATAELAALATALEAYRAQFGDYPYSNTSHTGTDQIVRENAEWLFGALAGLRGPRESASVWLNPARAPFLDLSRVRVEHPERLNLDADQDRNTFRDNWFIDPWGNEYIYLYPPPDSAAATNWRRDGYLLFSRGPSEEWQFTGSGIEHSLADTSRAANVDNIYAE
ncbi:MAG: prepilin-type N-terminal cleavage/methylation domain-containing protein [Puniceicoccaceae bacterium]|nr:MAG: prepilin-type N-terminal cleavage/methylation domain-containing protein [Puniceicoccaceae bacterium]